MAIAFQYDLFLSHSAKDKAAARPLAERLRADVPPTKAEGRMQKAEILHSAFCIHPSLCAFGSDWAQLEAGTFRFRDPLNKEFPFIPLRLEDRITLGLKPDNRYARNSRVGQRKEP